MSATIDADLLFTCLWSGWHGFVELLAGQAHRSRAGTFAPERVAGRFGRGLGERLPGDYVMELLPEVLNWPLFDAMRFDNGFGV